MMLELLEPTETRTFIERLLEPEPLQEPVLCRVRDDNHSPKTDYKPRYNPKLKCPPMVFPMLADENEKHGTRRSPMNAYGWEEYLRKLNGAKFDQAVGRTLAMFNHSGWPQMESLIFGCNLVRAVPSGKPGWARIITLNYYDGPPPGMPVYDEDPISVQKFTMICRGGGILSRVPELYYPVVCKYPVYMPFSWLEVVSDNMETPPPPER